jgi:YHS domain-containing protein
MLDWNKNKKELRDIMEMVTIWCDKKIRLYRLNGIGRLFISFLFVIAITSFAYAAGEHDNSHDHDTAVDSEQKQITNTYCPVMPDMQTNPEIFTDYKGKRVYFCCNNCKASFGKNPEKYLDQLPQFGGTLAQTGRHHEHRLELGRLIKPMGIITLSLLVLTAAGRLFRKKVPKFLVRWHKRLGIITLISALVHATLVLIAH